MQALMGMYDRGEAAPPLDGSYPVTNIGTLANRYRADIQTTTTVSWFAFEVPEGGLVSIDATTTAWAIRARCCSMIWAGRWPSTTTPGSGWKARSARGLRRAPISWASVS